MANLYALQSFKEDTIAVGDSLTTAETSTTLTTGAFTDTTLALLTFDYDVPASKEIIKCSISGSTVTVITRGMDGTSSVDHAAGAKVIMAFVPSHYSALTDFVGARAYLTNTLGTTVSGVATKVALDAESYDVGANFAASKFVAPVNGYYSINANIIFGNVATAAKKFYCQIYKNNALLDFSNTHSSFADTVSANISDVFYLDATDYIELFYLHTDATTVDITGTSSNTFFTVNLIKEV